MSGVRAGLLAFPAANRQERRSTPRLPLPLPLPTAEAPHRPRQTPPDPGARPLFPQPAGKRPPETTPESVRPASQPPVRRPPPPVGASRPSPLPPSRSAAPWRARCPARCAARCSWAAASPQAFRRRRFGEWRSHPRRRPARRPQALRAQPAAPAVAPTPHPVDGAHHAQQATRPAPPPA